jgi:hypothetical protein
MLKSRTENSKQNQAIKDKMNPSFLGGKNVSVQIFTLFLLIFLKNRALKSAGQSFSIRILLPYKDSVTV